MSASVLQRAVAVDQSPDSKILHAALHDPARAVGAAAIRRLQYINRAEAAYALHIIQHQARDLAMREAAAFMLLLWERESGMSYLYDGRLANWCAARRRSLEETVFANGILDAETTTLILECTGALGQKYRSVKPVYAGLSRNDASELTTFARFLALHTTDIYGIARATALDGELLPAVLARLENAGEGIWRLALLKNLLQVEPEHIEQYQRVFVSLLAEQPRRRDTLLLLALARRFVRLGLKPDTERILVWGYPHPLLAARLLAEMNEMEQAELLMRISLD